MEILAILDIGWPISVANYVGKMIHRWLVPVDEKHVTKSLTQNVSFCYVRMTNIFIELHSFILISYIIFYK